MDDTAQNVNYKPEPQYFLQHEFSTIAFLDYLTARPFDLLFQEKVLAQYQNKILGELVSVRNDIRENWIDDKVEDSITKLLTQTEQIARENGFNQSIRRQSVKYLIPFMVGFFALTFVIMFFVGDLLPADLSWIIYVIYALLLIVICLVPRYINQHLLRRWTNLSTEKSPLLRNYAAEPIEQLQKFVQFLIDDIRKICTVNKLDLANYRLMLFNNEYKNVRVMQEQYRKGVKFYVMELTPLDQELESESASPSEESFDEDFEAFKP